MLFDRLPDKKYMVGIDLQEQFCQISYLNGRKARVDQDPVTFSQVSGKAVFNIPLALCREPDSGSWSFGQEALERARQGGFLLTDLLALARREEPVAVGREEFLPEGLLALYLRRCLSILEMEVPAEETECIIFTAPCMDRETVRIMQRVMERLQPGVREVAFEDHQRSFYQYLLMQNEQQRKDGTLLCELSEEGALHLLRLRFNPGTRPVVCIPEEKDLQLEADTAALRDEELAGILEEELAAEDVGCIYLIGEGFSGDRMPMTQELAASGRRAFLGNNLYSKGAAYGALFRVHPPEAAGRYFLLEKDMLRSNLGIRAERAGRPGYHALLDAGRLWYEVDVTEDLLLADNRSLTLERTPMTGESPEELEVALENMPARDPLTTRVRIHMTMRGPDRLFLQIEDLGFGEISPSGGLRWEQELVI